MALRAHALAKGISGVRTLSPCESTFPARQSVRRASERDAWVRLSCYAAEVARSISVPARIVFAMSLDSSRYHIPFSNSMAG